MQKQQLISIKDAAISTGISEETIRQHIRSGKITGEKRNYIFWDEWFVSQKDLNKVCETTEWQVPASEISEAERLSRAPISAALVGAGMGISAATDNGIKSNVNFSWMPDLSTKFDINSNKFDSSGQSKHNSNSGKSSGPSETLRGASLPASLAAEIERAFAPKTANEAFGAKAYLEHTDEVPGQGAGEDMATDTAADSEAGARESNISKFAVGRPTGRRRRLEQKSEPRAAQKAEPKAEQKSTEQFMQNFEPTSGRSLEHERDFEPRTGDEVAQKSEVRIEQRAEQRHEAPWNDYRTIAKTVAEEFLAPLLSRLETQAALLAERDQLIAAQAAQLRLLPDFQRQSEEARKLAEQKQQEALQLKQTLTWERKKSLIKISAWQMKHVQVERQLKAVEVQISDAQEQKESEVKSLHSQLSQLQEQLAHANKPWWKKIFRS